MRDVADRAGVGLATVSRVVNGVSGVAPELAEKVREAARDLGYRHDATASSLRRADRRTNTVALVLEDVANPFSSALQRAVTDAAAERGILVLSGSSDENPSRERDLVETFIARRADGLIVVPTGRADDALRAAQSFGTPLVAVDRMVTWTAWTPSPSTTARAPPRPPRACAMPATAGSPTSATRRDLDRRRAPDRVLVTSSRPRDAGPPRPEQLEAAEQAAREVLAAAEPPTAFVSGQNLITIGIRRALQEAGWNTASRWSGSTTSRWRIC